MVMWYLTRPSTEFMPGTEPNYSPLEDLLTTSKGFAEDSQGRLWSLGEYYNIRYYDESIPEWITVPIVGWGSCIRKDPTLPGTIWATTDYEILRTDGINSFSRTIEDFPGSAAWFTGLAVDQDGIVWIGTWSQFTSTGSTLIRLDANTGEYQTWSYDEGWPFPGEHVTPDGNYPRRTALDAIRFRISFNECRFMLV